MGTVENISDDANIGIGTVVNTLGQRLKPYLPQMKDLYARQDGYVDYVLKRPVHAKKKL